MGRKPDLKGLAFFLMLQEAFHPGCPGAVTWIGVEVESLTICCPAVQMGCVEVQIGFGE